MSLSRPLAAIDPWEVTNTLQHATSRRAVHNAMRDLTPILSADIVESPNDFHVHVDLPGVAPEDLDVSISNGYIHLQAERKQVHEDTLGFNHSIERSYGRISRDIQIPTRADMDSAKASFRHGVLSITFRKQEGIVKKLTITST